MQRRFYNDGVEYAMTVYEGNDNRITLYRKDEKGAKTKTLNVVYDVSWAWSVKRDNILSCNNAHRLFKEWERCIDEKFMMYPVYSFWDKVMEEN